LSYARLIPYVVLSPLIPLVVTGRMTATVFSRGRNRREFLTALPAFVLLSAVWTLGEVVGYVAGRRDP
jgi:hypothetical protein